MYQNILNRRIQVDGIKSKLSKIQHELPVELVGQRNKATKDSCLSSKEENLDMFSLQKFRANYPTNIQFPTIIIMKRMSDIDTHF